MCEPWVRGCGRRGIIAVFMRRVCVQDNVRGESLLHGVGLLEGLLRAVATVNSIR